MKFIVFLVLCIIATCKGVYGVNLDGYSFDNQIEGKIPPLDPFPLSTSPDINNAAELSFVLGKTGNAGNNNGHANDTLTTITAPSFVWGDSAGNIFFSSPLSHVIRKVAADSNIVSNFVGTGTAGYNGEGMATAVQLRKPQGIFGDNDRLVLCDTLNGRIRQVNFTTNVLTNIAGSGPISNLRGYDGDGDLAISSRLFSPFAIWIDLKDNRGDIYFTELHKCTVRKIDGVSKIITTIAGIRGQCGFNGYDGVAAQTKLFRPCALFGDSKGALLVADFGNNLVRRYNTSSGKIITIAGKGNANKANIPDRGNGGIGENSVLIKPTGVWQDREGNVYIAESFSSVVRKIDASTGLISTAVGVLGIKGPFTKVGDNALYHPRGIWGDESVTMRLYIPDTGNHRIMSYSLPTPSSFLQLGVRTTFGGDGSYGLGVDNVPASSTSLRNPTRTWQDTSGNVYITDGFNRVIKVDGDSGIRTTFASGFSFAACGIYGDSQNIYVGTSSNLLSFPLSPQSLPATSTTIVGGGGTVLSTVGDSATGLSVSLGDGIFDFIDIWIDNSDEIKYITGKKQVYQVLPESIGSISHTITLLAQTSDPIWSITGDNHGFLYIGSDYRIYQVNLNDNNALTIFMGSGTPGYTPDGSIASLSTPLYYVAGLTIDSDKNIYFSDNFKVIRKIAVSNKRLSTVAGNFTSLIPFASQSNSLNGFINEPRGVSWNADQTLLICEYQGHQVHKITFH